ncbi:MAG: hypothetical protein MI748_07840, partial [Opitutales bacterium]|nr:hypothetical protein [Opitutales bacterium]
DVETGFRIAEYLETMIGRIPLLTSRLHELVRIETYTRSEAKKDDRYAPLWDFAASGGDNAATVYDEQNILQRVLTLATAIRGHAASILGGAITITAARRVVVFAEECFNAELNRINRIIYRIENVRYDLPSFPLERFLRIHRKTALASANERSAVDLIEDFSLQLVQIADKLARFTGNRRESVGSVDSIAMPYPPVAFSKPFIAPEIELLISGDGPFAGRSILDAMTEIAQIGFLAGRLFEEKSIINDLREISGLRAELEGIMISLKRIANREVYDAVRERWIV